MNIQNVKGADLHAVLTWSDKDTVESKVTPKLHVCLEIHSIDLTEQTSADQICGGVDVCTRGRIQS